MTSVTESKLVHTPTPWACGPTGKRMADEYSQSMAIVGTENTTLIAGLFSDVKGGPEVAKANAKLIVRSVNERADLVSALVEARQWLKYLGVFNNNGLPGTAQRIDDAITKAQS